MSNFKKGMRVARVSGFSGHSHTEDFVLKVHKNGNFTLRSDPKQQWKPWGYSDAPRAEKTGETSHYPTTVQIWDDAFDQRLAKEAIQKEHNHTAYELENTIKRMQLKFLSGPDLLELKALIDRLTSPKER